MFLRLDVVGMNKTLGSEPDVKQVEVKVISGAKHAIHLCFEHELSEDEIGNAEHAVELISPFVFKLLECTISRMRLIAPDEESLREQVLRALEAEYRAYCLCTEAKMSLEGAVESAFERSES